MEKKVPHVPAVQITWRGHACFQLTYEDYSIVIDPYKDGSVAGLAPLRLRANQVLCSHGHDDHNYCAAVRIVGASAPSPFSVTRIATFHDDAQGEKRGQNTIHLFEVGGMRIAHFGDLGCELTSEQAAALSGLDAAMIPVGGYYTIDARQAQALVRAISPKVVLPMHYRGEKMGLDVLGTLEEFTRGMDNVIYYADNTLLLHPGIEPQTAILRYKPE